MADFDFVIPPWLQDQDADSIHARMMASLPEDIDDTEGGFPWDFTRPAALEKAELLEFQMIENVRAMFYQFAGGIYLDYHAAEAGLTRKAPVRASGNVKVTGTPGINIPEGFLFAVPTSGDTPAILFAARESKTIPAGGVVEISVQAADAGIIGNVGAGTIVVMASGPLQGIAHVINEEAVSGGAESESDEELRVRIADVYTNKGLSFVGNNADYVRWAMEVDSVGAAVVEPEWNGPGTVALIVMDRTGFRADQSILDTVYEHIMAPNDPMKRLAPVGVELTVKTPEELSINISCELVLESEAVYNTVCAAIRENIKSCFLTAAAEGIVRYAEIGAVIIQTEGVQDYGALLVNGSGANISFTQEQFPVLGTLNISARGDN